MYICEYEIHGITKTDYIPHTFDLFCLLNVYTASLIYLNLFILKIIYIYHIPYSIYT